MFPIANEIGDKVCLIGSEFMPLFLSKEPIIRLPGFYKTVDFYDPKIAIV